MHLPDMSGLEVVRQLDLEMGRGLLITILTADCSTPTIIKAMSLGAYEYWTKPIDFLKFDAGLRRALERRPPHPSNRPRQAMEVPSRRLDLSDYL